MKRILVFLTACATLLTVAPPTIAHADDDDSASPMVCAMLPVMLDRYHEEHILHDAQDKTIRDRVIDVYAKSIDRSKLLLTQSEFDTLVERVTNLVESDLANGNCDTFTWLLEQEVAWHKSMEDYVRGVLAEDFEIDRSLELVTDSDKRKRPTNDAERNELRNRVIQFQLANYLSAGVELDEAKEKLIKRYELTTKRMSEREQHDIFADFLNAYSTALDPHTSYFSVENLEDFRISMDLSLEGIGAVLTSRDGFTIVREVVPGGAADRQGQLQPKDKIVAVTQGKKGEAVPVIDMDLNDVVRLIRGKKGTQVKLTILRQEEETERFDILITRDKIDLKHQAARIRWEQAQREGETLDIAVIELPSFYGGRGDARDSTEDMKELLEKAVEKGADGVVLDLSRNGGGLLQAAVEISGHFLASGPIVSVDGRNQGALVLEDTDPAIVYNGPLVVLTSRFSASASEILAGALSDYGRAVIVGDSHTFGKGTVQNIITLPPGFGALKVTTGMFYLPGGQSTQNLGVEADITLPSVIDTASDFGEKHMDYALPPRKVKDFRGSRYNAKKGGFSPVDDDTIRALAKASRERVKESDDFDEIRDAIAKRAVDDPDVITISELLDEDSSQSDEDDFTPEAEKELTPQAKEAIQIAADLVALEE